MLRRLALLLVLLAACGDNDVAAPPDALDPDAGTPGDILAQLEALPGVTAEEWIPPEGFEPPEGYRFFDLWFTQPVDHDDPGAGSFQQYAALMHVDPEAPLVVYTSGYDAGWRRWLTEPAWLLEGNQISLEYRFYGESRPADAIPWPLLRIEQASADQHAILELLDGIYSGNTITTGASKGGEHALQYAQLYPDDVDGVVAYVAPVITDFPDLRYQGIFDRIGLADCRARLRAAARELLIRREAIIPLVLDDPFWPSSYQVAGVDHAYETAVVELEFGFWMTRGEEDCTQVPEATASDTALYQLLADTGHPAAYGDEALAVYGTQYLYQDHVELGYPIWDHAYLDDLMTYSYEDWSAYLPPGEPLDYDPALPRALETWIEDEAEQILMINGEWDPWAAGVPELAPGRDALSLWVPHGSHWSSSFFTLAADDFQVAYDALRRWAGVTARQARPRRAPPAPMATRGPGD